jgi:hypothetical protein
MTDEQSRHADDVASARKRVRELEAEQARLEKEATGMQVGGWDEGIRMMYDQVVM